MDATHGGSRWDPDRERAEAEERPLVLAAALLEGLPDAVVASTRQGRIVFVNALAEELFGYDRGELLGQPVASLWPERVRRRYVRNMELYFQGEHPLRFSSEAYGVRRDGTEFIGEMSWGIVRTDIGPLLLAIGRDITRRLATEERLRALRGMADRALAGADPLVLAGEAVELLMTRLPVSGAQVRLGDGTVLASEGPVEVPPVRLPIGDGDELVVAPEGELDDEALSIVGAVAHTLATALARLRSEERMRHEALHDPLTGLANRTLLRDRLGHALARCEREGGETGVLLIDLDNFKDVNDDHGHAVGDAVLVALAERLRTAVRPVDTVARLGGDEFVVICEQVDEREAVALGLRVEEAIRGPLVVGGATHVLSASIGVAVGHGAGEALLQDADAAAYRAKAASGGRVELSR